MKALIIDKIPEVIETSLKNHGVETEVAVMPGVDYLKQHIGEADLLVMRVVPQIDRELLDLAHNLKMIAVCSVGTTHIDLAYAKEKGIQIINAPGASANAVAELAISKMMD